MDLNVETSETDETHVIEVGLSDTVEDMRRKVASAVGLPEDSFVMSFGDEAMGEGADMTQLSAGDTILLTKSMKFQAIAALRELGETDLMPERLKEVKDPEVACLLLQAEVTTVIPTLFLSSASFTGLDLSAVTAVTRIENDFLFQCTSLTAVDLSSFKSLTHVGEYFLCNCRSLTALNLSSLNKLTQIGDRFLLNCKMLTSLDLSSLTSLTKFEDRFLSNCTSLATLNFSALKNLTYMGNYFLRGCTNLTTLDLSSLENVTHVGQNFCEQTNLQTIRLSGCSAVVLHAVELANLSAFVVSSPSET